MNDQAVIEVAVLELVHRHSLDEIESVLVASGVTRESAAKAVLLIPSAFAAVHYGPQDIAFPTHFQIGPPDARRLLPYGEEPLYQEAKALAHRLKQAGRLSLIARVLDWSAEANAIKQAHAEGLHPTKLSEVHHGDWWP